jgi:hypothetical protein
VGLLYFVRRIALIQKGAAFAKMNPWIDMGFEDLGVPWLRLEPQSQSCQTKRAKVHVDQKRWIPLSERRLLDKNIQMMEAGATWNHW